VWGYYQKTRDERKDLFDWYFKVVALPLTAMGAVFGVAGGMGQIREMGFCARQRLFVIAAFALFVVLVVGIILYITYAKISSNAGKFKRVAEELRRLLLQRYQGRLAIPNVDTWPKQNRERKGWQLPCHGLKSIKLWRGMTMAVINSAIGVACLVLTCWALGVRTWPLWLVELLAPEFYLVGFFLVFVLLQIWLYCRQIDKYREVEPSFRPPEITPGRDGANGSGFGFFERMRGWEPKRRLVIVGITAGHLPTKRRDELVQFLKSHGELKIDVCVLDPSSPCAGLRSKEVHKSGMQTGENVKASIDAWTALADEFPGRIVVRRSSATPCAEYEAADPDDPGGLIYFTPVAYKQHTNVTPSLILRKGQTGYGLYDFHRRVIEKIVADAEEVRREDGVPGNGGS
jgi:hypothetical protein